MGRPAVSVFFKLAVLACVVATAGGLEPTVSWSAEGASCAAQEEEEVVLLARRHVSKLEQEEALDKDSRGSPPLLQHELPCSDSPPGWRDNKDFSCRAYVKRRWCTEEGGYGSGWWTVWGTMESYASDGVDARQACCGCGGGQTQHYTHACHVTETTNSAQLGLNAYYTTDSNPSGCNEDSCTPAAFLQHGLQRVIVASASAAGLCNCWARERDYPDDPGEAAPPVSTDLVFLFSYVAGQPSHCSATGCWDRYGEVFHLFRESGSARGPTQAVPAPKAGDSLGSAQHWSARCAEVPGGVERGHFVGAPPVVYLVNMLQNSDTTDSAARILAMVHLKEDTDSQEVTTAEQDHGGVPPPNLRTVLGELVHDWQAPCSDSFWIDWINTLTDKVIYAIYGESGVTTILGTTFGSSYQLQQLSFLFAGLQGVEEQNKWYLELSDGGYVADGPGPNTTGYYSWTHVRKLLEDVGAKLESGKAVRQNELGMQILNGVMWPEAPGGERTIFLGANLENHAVVRPLLADALDNARGGAECDGSTCWSPEWLRVKAREFLNGRKIVQSDDMKWFVTTILHKVHLNMDLIEGEAKDFADYMSKVVLVIPFTENTANSWLFRTALGIPELQAQRAGYLEKFKPAIAAKFPSANLSEAELGLAASAFLDSLQFAGGLSVPTVLTYVLALTHQSEGSKLEALKGVELNESNIEDILWESMRLYPPVAGFPYWEQEDTGGWHHHLPNVNMALQDPAIYDDPLTFKFRSVEYLKGHSIGWVDFATYPNGVTAETIRAPHSHRCPGKDLSIEIMVAFLQEFVAAGPWKSMTRSISVNAYMASAFSLKRDLQGRCWQPPKACSKSWIYRFKKYHGCTDRGHTTMWCSHYYVPVYGQWSECQEVPCEVEPEGATDEHVLSDEMSALDAQARCRNCSSSPKSRAACVCKLANAAAESARSQRCVALSAVALEIGHPFSCVIRAQEHRGQKLCKVYKPWTSQLSSWFAVSWDSVKRWGQGLVPTSQCYPSSGQCCSQWALGTRSARCREVTAATLSTEWMDLPPQLRGYFWLTLQGDSSALMTFGRSRDGCGLSSGRIDENATYYVRVAGDKTWSFATTDGGTFAFCEAVDLVYEFRFDDAEDPTSADIIPTLRNVVGITAPQWLLSFTMSLATNQTEFPGSVVWRRKTDLLFGTRSVKKGGSYDLVQVVDEHGRRLPAFDTFVELCEDPEYSGASSPGTIWYHDYELRPFALQTWKVEMDRCPSVLSFLLPKTVTTAFMVGHKFGLLDFVDRHHGAPLDRRVMDDFTYLMVVASLHAELPAFKGATVPAVDRICPPTESRPLNKMRVWNSVVPIEEIDQEMDCFRPEWQPNFRGSTPESCGYRLLMRLPLEDNIVNAGTKNTWSAALAGKEGMSKEDYILSLFKGRENLDGDPLYPVPEIKYTQRFQVAPGIWKEGLEAHLALDMLGTHLVREVEGTALSHGGETAALVLRLNGLSDLERRPGFGAWGGDMYFTAEGMAIGVETRLPDGTTQMTWADAPPEEWQYAKFVFRSTLMNAVTVIDHLWFAHLTVSNSMALVTRETLLPEHPLRRILSAVTFGTIDVNDKANIVLLGPKQILHRGSPFKSWGTVQAAVEDSIKTFEEYFGPIVDSGVRARLHPRLQRAPLFTDGPGLFQILSGLIDGIFSAMGEEWCNAETGAIQDQQIYDYTQGIEKWFRDQQPSQAEANLAWFKGSTLAPWTCAATKKLIKVQLFSVSGWHQHVGKVADLVRNPELVSISWADREVGGRPQQAILYSLVSASTAYKGVTLDTDFGFLAQGLKKEAELQGVFKDFRAALGEFALEVDRRNEARAVPYTRMHPSKAEISLYQ